MLKDCTKIIYWQGHIILIFFLIQGCTYGPPQERVKIENGSARFNTYTAAVVLNHWRELAPTGLSTFPDGGAPKILEQAALVYLCDIDTAKTKLLAKIIAPDDVRIGFTPWIIGWADDYFYVALTGRSGTKLRDFKRVRITHFYRIALDGTYQEVETRPSNLSQLPNSTNQIKGEKNFMRISYGYSDIAVRLKDEGPYRKMFEVNQAKGTLDSVR